MTHEHSTECTPVPSSPAGLTKSPHEKGDSTEAGNTETGHRRTRQQPDMPRKRLSYILAEVVADTSRDRISVDDLVKILKARAFGAMLLIFALPNALPAPPGTSGILGLPLLFLSAQMMLGKMPWLPPFIGNRSMMRQDFAALNTRVTPWLMRAERLLVPRLLDLSAPRAQRMIGGLCLILSVVLVLPIPLGNMLPAFAICLIALGVLERDGVWIIGGVAAALTALLIVYGVVYAIVSAAIFVIIRAF